MPLISKNHLFLTDYHDKILFLYYPKTHFTKYYNDNDYIAYSIDKYNFAETLDKGTTYDAFKNGYDLYKLFF